MLDKLYENIGEKIKNWAKWIFIVEAISAVIGGFVLVGNDGVAIGLIVLLAGPVIAWISSWLLYAFGQLVEDVNTIRYQGSTKSAESVKAESASSVPQSNPLENIDENNVQYRSGKCDLCNTTSEQLLYCKIVDDLGTRYRTICKDCIVKHGATPEK